MIYPVAVDFRQERDLLVVRFLTDEGERIELGLNRDICGLLFTIARLAIAAETTTENNHEHRHD